MSVRQEIPVSLGKPSLRLRMEAYYSLVAPDIIANETAWRSKFDLIYEKFGGSYEKERLLATKLAKKYGATVKLLLAESVAANKRGEANRLDAEAKRDEDWYTLRDNEQSSGILNFTSSSFDPVAALAASEDAVAKANDWFQSDGPILDYIDQFRTQLPSCDPLRRIPPASRKRGRHDDTSVDTSKRTKKLSAFASIASVHETGPLSLLHTAFTNRYRVRIIIRYVNGIRGTLTGYLLAFDKHFNMILRDVDEVYSPRNASSENMSNVERELLRRQAAINGNHQRNEWSIRQRHMKQMMVRGDNVVAVYKAESEQSAWPRTSKSPPESRYQKDTKNVPHGERVGTPGSLVFAIEQQKRQSRGQRKRHRSL